MQKYAINTVFDTPVLLCTTKQHHMQCSILLDAVKNVNHQYSSIFPQLLPKYHSINHKIQSLPDFIFPKIFSLARFQLNPSSADEKKAIFLKKQHSAPSAFAIECQLCTSSFDHARNSSIRATLDSQCSNASSLHSHISSLLLLIYAGFGWVHTFYTHPLLLADSSASRAFSHHSLNSAAKIEVRSDDW